MRARKSRGEWAAIVEAFGRLGAVAQGVLFEARLKIESFRGWLYRLRTAARSVPEVALVPVEVTAGPSGSRGAREEVGPAELVVAISDIGVRVSLGTDIEYVARLVAELRARC